MASKSESLLGSLAIKSAVILPCYRLMSSWQLWILPAWITSLWDNLQVVLLYIINRPGVAGAALQIPLWFINWLIKWLTCPFPLNLQNIITPIIWAWELKFWENVYYVSHVRRHVLHVKYIYIYIYIFFSLQVVGLVGGGSVIIGTYTV